MFGSPGKPTQHAIPVSVIGSKSRPSSVNAFAATTDAGKSSDASVFARIALLAYVLLIVYASWFPFSGWRSTGLSPLAFVTAPLPYYWTWFDVATNVVGYVPLGILAVFSLYPTLRGWSAVLATIVAGIALSALMEALQTYLPSRVASNLDWLTNSTGLGIGALIAPMITRTFLEESRFLQFRDRWFTREASRGLLVVSLWPLAQIYPQSYLFGHGQLLHVVSDWVSTLLSIPIDLGAMLRGDTEFTVEQYWLVETIISASGLTGALLALCSILRSRAPRGVLLFLFFCAALTIKFLVSALMYGPDNAFGWLTPGAAGGLLLALVMLTGLIFAPRGAQRRAAILMLLICVATVNCAPANPYFQATMQGWSQGKFLNFNGAAQFLSLLWPYLALWFLLHHGHRSVTSQRLFQTKQK
jgi:VanZ family protein